MAVSEGTAALGLSATQLVPKPESQITQRSRSRRTICATILDLPTSMRCSLLFDAHHCGDARDVRGKSGTQIED